MVQAPELPRLGSYVLTRPLAPHALARRWLALHDGEQSSHVAYRFPACHDKHERRRFLSAVEAVAALDHPHILRIEQFSFDSSGRLWVICPFGGDADGVRPLRRLLREKGGQMMPDEGERAVRQLLEACRYAHEQGSVNGPIAMDDALVARNGSVQIELYSLSRGLRGLVRGNSELIRDEVRSIVEIGYELITGLRCEEPIIPAHRLVKRLEQRWTDWFEAGLDPSAGFATPDEALDSLARRDSDGRRPVGGGWGVLSRRRAGE